MFVECFESIENLYEKFYGLFLTKSLLLLQVLRQIAFVTVFQYQVKIVGSLLDVIEFDYIFVVACTQHLDFVLQQL